MRVSTNVFQAVDDLCFQFYQRLNRHFIDFFEGLSIDICKVFGLKLLDQLWIGSLHISFSDGAVLVKSKMFFS